MTFEESEKLWESIEMVKDVLMSSDQVIEKLPPDQAQFITAYNQMQPGEISFFFQISSGYGKQIIR